MGSEGATVPRNRHVGESVLPSIIWVPRFFRPSSKPFIHGAIVLANSAFQRFFKLLEVKPNLNSLEMVEGRHSQYSPKVAIIILLSVMKWWPWNLLLRCQTSSRWLCCMDVIMATSEYLTYLEKHLKDTHVNVKEGASENSLHRVQGSSTSVSFWEYYILTRHI